MLELVAQRCSNKEIAARLVISEYTVKNHLRNILSKLHLRSRAEFTTFFDGLELVEPGIVYLPEWHPEEIESRATKKLANDPAFVGHLCGLGRKP